MLVNNDYLELNTKNIEIAKKLVKEHFRKVHMISIESLKVVLSVGGKYVYIGFYAFASLGVNFPYYNTYMVDYSCFEDNL
ncbi:MAG: hypothetical protein HFG90_01440 [Acholeplasmatales bacterium]|nr:hypothetical protein [Acholeplasmatales bacterium]